MAIAFLISRNKSINLENANLYVESVDEMQIENVTNSKIIENNSSYIENNLGVNKNNFDPDLSENILQLLQ